MASNAITSFPEEIIVYILEDKRLNFCDVVNFSSTCKHLYKIVNDSNKLWKTKFFQRWPLLKEAYQTNQRLENQMLVWKEEIKASLSTRRKLIDHLSMMSSKHFRKQELSDVEFKEYNPLFHPEEGAHPLGYYFLVDELMSLIRYPAMASNLTHRYYALKVIRYLKQSHLKNEWQKFISLPAKKQTLEYGATIVAHWSQPERDVSYSSVSSALDNIAQQTKELLREQYPNHSIFSTPEEQFIQWKNNIIDDNQWSITETKQVTNALCEVLFQKLGFYGNSAMYYSLESSFIDRVLEHKCGIPITLAIVFESVARRLGIRCEPVSFPSHFLLRWKETYGPKSKDKENFYIDVFNGGEFLTKKDCPRIGDSKCPIAKYNVHEPATAVEVITKMASNIETAARQHTQINIRTARLRSALELRYMIEPSDTDIILQLGRIYLLQDMDLTELVKIVENMQKDSELTSRGQANDISQRFKNIQQCHKNLQLEEEVKPKERVPGVKYAIGLIMKHKVLGYLCVITGWDARLVPSPKRMNVWNEMNVDADTFYNVFVDDGSCQYVAQENLQLASNPEWINHHAIGRYFYKFNGTHYVPNEEEAREYPEDEKVRNELLAKHEMSRNTT